MPDVSTIQTSVLNHGFSPANYSSRIIDWINEGQNRILRRANIRVGATEQDISTTNNTYVYPLPDDFARFESLFRNNLLIPEISHDEFDSLFNLNISTASNPHGEPDRFTIDGTNIKFYPVPNGAYAYQLRYWSVPTTALTISDTPIIPEDYQYLLEHYALYRAYLAENDYSESKEHKAIFENDLLELMGELQTDTDKPPNQVEGGWALDAWYP